MTLTAAEVARISTPGRHLVERGLYILVAPGGSRSWAQRVYLGGKRTDKGLGGYPLVGLRQALKMADRNRAALAAGRNPWAGKKTVDSESTVLQMLVTSEIASVQRGITFEEAAQASISENGRLSDQSKHQRQDRLDKHILPALGKRAVESLTRRDVLEVLLPLKDKHETRNKALGEIKAVLDWAEAYDHIEVNPARSAKVKLQIGMWGGRPAVNHRKALHYSAIPRLLADIRDSDAARSTKDAVKLMILTAARPGEVAGMTWGEIDEEIGLWTLPPSRMKMARGHRVPLSVQASVLLRMRRDLKGYQPGGLVFPSPRKGKCLAVNTFAKLFREHGVGAVPHGCRSSFRDWAAEHSGASREAIEKALAHVVGNAVERAYFRSDLLNERRGLQQAWADFVDPTVF